MILQILKKIHSIVKMQLPGTGIFVIKNPFPANILNNRMMVVPFNLNHGALFFQQFKGRNLFLLRIAVQFKKFHKIKKYHAKYVWAGIFLVSTNNSALFFMSSNFWDKAGSN